MAEIEAFCLCPEKNETEAQSNWRYPILAASSTAAAISAALTLSEPNVPKPISEI